MKGRNGEESEYVVHDDALKKIVRKGRRRPVAFAFVPTFGDDESMFAVHKKRKPEVIARKTRMDSGQSRIAYGTFVVIGKTMVLTCIRELPSIAKKLKKHMRAERLPLNVRVLDMLGRELEADIDDLDDGDDPLGPDDDDDDDDEDLIAAAPTTQDAFGDRIAAIRPAILAASGLRGDRLRDLLAGVLGAIEAGRRAEAAPLLTRLEAEVAALMNSTDRPQIAAAADAGRKAAPAQRPSASARRVTKPEAAPAKDPADPAEALRIARHIAALRTRIDALTDEAAGRLHAALALAAGAVRAGRHDSAVAAVKQIAQAVGRAEARQAASTGSGA